MTTFHVQTKVLVERWYRVEADSPEEAAELVLSGKSPTYHAQNDLDTEDVGEVREPASVAVTTAT